MNNERINSFPFNPTDFPFNIEISGITNCDEQYIVHREKSYCYILEYIYGGSGTLFCNGRKFTVRAGDVYLLPKGSDHRYYPDQSWDKIWFNLDGTLVSSLIYSYGLNDVIVFKNFGKKEYFDTLYDITNSRRPTEDIMFDASVQFHRIVQELYRSQQTFSFDGLFNRIKKMLDDNIYQKELSLAEIARQLCISQAQVINIFKRTYNMTPHQYFTKRRIEIAASLLLESKLQIKEIAELLNYSDQPYFSNAFKKYMGISPEKYRRMNVSHDLSHSNVNNKYMTEQDDNLPFLLKVERH